MAVVFHVVALFWGFAPCSVLTSEPNVVTVKTDTLVPPKHPNNPSTICSVTAHKKRFITVDCLQRPSHRQIVACLELH